MVTQWGHDPLAAEKNESFTTSWCTGINLTLNTNFTLIYTTLGHDQIQA